MSKLIKKEYEYKDKDGNTKRLEKPLVVLDKKNMIKEEPINIKIMSDIWSKEIPKKDGTKFKRYGCYGFLGVDSETCNFEWGENEQKQFEQAQVKKFDEVTIYIKPEIKETLYYKIDKK